MFDDSRIFCSLAKPSSPQGPLEVSDVTKTGCKLKWKKPEDDGGLPIKEYEIEKMDTATGRWVRVGKVPGGDKPELEMNVTGLEPNSEYKFRVTAVNDEGDSEPLVTEKPIVAKNPYGMMVKIDLVLHKFCWSKKINIKFVVLRNFRGKFNQNAPSHIKFEVKRRGLKYCSSIRLNGKDKA